LAPDRAQPRAEGDGRREAARGLCGARATQGGCGQGGAGPAHPRLPRSQRQAMKEIAMQRKWTVLASTLGIAALGLVSGRCAPTVPKGTKKAAAAVSDVAVAAQKTYIAPGDLDEFYMFASGGHSGQVYVYGVPSMRHLSTIPVFTPYPATGYGFDDDS